MRLALQDVNYQTVSASEGLVVLAMESTVFQHLSERFRDSQQIALQSVRNPGTVLAAEAAEQIATLAARQDFENLCRKDYDDRKNFEKECWSRTRAGVNGRKLRLSVNGRTNGGGDQVSTKSRGVCSSNCDQVNSFRGIVKALTILFLKVTLTCIVNTSTTVTPAPAVKI